MMFATAVMAPLCVSAPAVAQGAARLADGSSPRAGVAPKAGGSHLHGPLLFDTGIWNNTPQRYFAATRVGSFVDTAGYSTEAQALALATQWDFPLSTSTGLVRYPATGVCLDDTGTAIVVGACNASAASQQWRWVSLTNEYGASGQSLQNVSSGHYLDAIGGVSAAGSKSKAAVVLTGYLAPQADTDGLTAKITSIDDDAKSATLTGTATPGASIRRNGVQIAVANPQTGIWTATVSGLAVGGNALKIDQYVGGTYVDSVTLQATVKPPVNVTTNVGVYDLTVRPDTGTAFMAGATGTASLASHPATGSIGLTVKVGQSISWTVVLPAGLVPTLPAPNGSPLWDTVYSSTPQTDGTTKVTKTMTRKGSDTTSAGVDDGGFAFVVTATAALVDKAPVTALFTPVTGWTSSSPTGSTTVSVDTTPPVVDPTAVWKTEADVTKKGTVSGTGVEGATITIKDGTTTLGTATVVNGMWTFDVAPLRPGIVPLTIEQSGGGSATVTADFGNAVAVTAPTSGPATPGKTTVKGTGATGAKVTATLDGSTCTADVVGGEWSCDLTLQNPAERTLHVTQQARGSLTTTTDVVVNPGVTAKFAITAPADDQLFESPTETMSISGTGLAGATVVVKKSNGQPVGTGSTIVGPDGTWTIAGEFNFVDYIVTAVQQPYQGSTTATDTVHFRHVKPGLNLPLTVTYPGASAHVTAVDGKVTLTGTGRANSAITIRNGADGSGRFIGNATVASDGTWKIEGEFDTTIYTVKVTQTPLAGSGAPSSITHTFTVDPTGITQPFSIDTPTEGSTYPATDGQVTISGRGSTGATVQLTNNANGRPINATPVTIGVDGTWSITGPFQNLTYTVKAWYKLGGQTTNALRSFTVGRAGVQHDFSIDTPLENAIVPGTPGQTPPQRLVTLTGQGTTGAIVQIVNKANGRPVDAANPTVTVDPTGHWTVTGTFQPSKYTVVVYYKLSGVTTTSERTFTVQP